MKSAAIFIVILGAGSALFKAVGFEYLFWINRFEEEIGWLICIAMMLTGVGLLGVLKYFELKKALAEEMEVHAD